MFEVDDMQVAQFCAEGKSPCHLELDHVNFFDEIIYEGPGTPNDDNNLNAQLHNEGSNSSQPSNPTIDFIEDDLGHPQCSNGSASDNEMCATFESDFANHDAMSVIDDEETLILEEDSRSKMFEKEDPEAVKQNISHKPIDYDKLNRLSEDFVKRFTPQQELSAKQAFWLRISNPTIESSNKPPVIVEVPSELPKVSLVNASLKKLKFHLAQFDSMVKKRTTPDARTEGEWEFEHTKVVFNNEIIPFLKSLKGIFNVFDRDLLNEIMLLHNRDAHIDYLKYTQEQADILWGIELLVYVRDACPNTINLNAKKVAVTPKNKVKKVMFAEPLTSSSNTKQVESSTTSDSNTLVLSPTGLKCSTSNYGSKPTCNKKNDRISRTPSRNMENKVEAQPRKVNKKNRVFEPIRDVDVKHSLLKANSELICSTCKKFMFDGVHDMCLLDFVENMNSRAKYAKKHKKTKYLETYGITSVNVVPPKKTTSHSVKTQKAELKVYSRKPKNVKNVGSSKKAKIVESKNANHSEPNHTWGSNATDIPSSSSLVMTGCPDCSLVSGLRMFETYDREPLSTHELYEAPESIIKCIKNIQVRLNATVRNVRTDNGTEFVNQTLRDFYENVGISHQTSVARTPQQNDVVERRNRTLVEAARTMLIFSKAPLLLWAEAINTSCYTQNRSLIRLRYNKTPYELMQDKKPDLSFFHVFGSLCYPTNDNDDLGKLDAKADIDDWDHLFQPMFDEYFNPPSIAVTPVQEAAAPRAVVLADSLVSTSIDQDAPLIFVVIHVIKQITLKYL
ncbi:retrovirus-related pol polyprotein from transposon TNT 1-94 [Tanacetum coccineum]